MEKERKKSRNFDWLPAFQHYFKKGKNGLYNCSCCGNYTFDADYQLFGVACSVCYWEYCLAAVEEPNIAIGTNSTLSLNQAKENYKKFGAIREEYKSFVRPPLPEELPENNI